MKSRSGHTVSPLAVNARPGSDAASGRRQGQGPASSGRGSTGDGGRRASPSGLRVGLLLASRGRRGTRRHREGADTQNRWPEGSGPQLCRWSRAPRSNRSDRQAHKSLARIWGRASWEDREGTTCTARAGRAQFQQGAPSSQEAAFERNPRPDQNAGLAVGSSGGEEGGFGRSHCPLEAAQHGQPFDTLPAAQQARAASWDRAKPGCPADACRTSISTRLAGV